MLGAVKRGSLMRCAMSSPLSSADLQRAMNNLINKYMKGFHDIAKDEYGSVFEPHIGKQNYILFVWETQLP